APDPATAGAWPVGQPRPQPEPPWAGSALVFSLGQLGVDDLFQIVPRLVLNLFTGNDEGRRAFDLVGGGVGLEGRDQIGHLLLVVPAGIHLLIDQSGLRTDLAKVSGDLVARVGIQPVFLIVKDQVRDSIIFVVSATAGKDP